jgi:hypothetical protein
LPADRTLPPLCWSQRYLWLSHWDLPVHARREYNIPLRFDPPAGATVDSLRFVLDYLVRRHETLRTTFVHTGSGVAQRVHPPRPPRIDHFETQDDSGSSPARVINEVTSAPFDLGAEWPVRALIVTTGSVPTLLLVVVHHTTMDDWAINRLHHELKAVHQGLAARRPVSLPPVRHRPADLARYEASPAAAGVNERALAYWDEHLSRIPADVFGSRRAPGDDEPPVRSATLSSPDAAGAARRLAARYRVWPTLIYSAAFAALLSAYTGNDDVFFRTYAANRDSGPRAELMSSLSQPTLLHVDHLGEVPFEEVVRRMSEQTEQALRHSYCAYDQALERVVRHSDRRGLGLRLGVFFNYLSYAPAACGVRRTRFSWNQPPLNWALQDDDLYFRVYEYRDGIVVAINVGSTVMSGDEVGAFLRGFEKLLVEQADSAGELVVSDLPDMLGFTRRRRALPVIDHAPVDTAEITRCLAAHPEVSAAATFLTGNTVTAHVATGSLTPADLRTYLLGRMYGDPGVRVPHEFVLYSSAPDRPDEAGAWRALPSRIAGTGALAGDHPPGNDSEKALFGAVRAANRLDDFSMAHSYVGAGGRVLNIPIVQEILREQGWTPARLRELASALPLREIASRMCPDVPPAVHRAAGQVP